MDCLYKQGVNCTSNTKLCSVSSVLPSVTSLINLKRKLGSSLFHVTLQCLEYKKINQGSIQNPIKHMHVF